MQQGAPPPFMDLDFDEHVAQSMQYWRQHILPRYATSDKSYVTLLAEAYEAAVENQLYLRKQAAADRLNRPPAAAAAAAPTSQTDGMMAQPPRAAPSSGRRYDPRAAAAAPAATVPAAPSVPAPVGMSGEEAKQQVRENARRLRLEKEQALNVAIRAERQQAVGGMRQRNGAQPVATPAPTSAPADQSAGAVDSRWQVRERARLAREAEQAKLNEYMASQRSEKQRAGAAAAPAARAAVAPAADGGGAMDPRQRVREQARLEREAEAAKLNGYLASERAQQARAQQQAQQAQQQANALAGGSASEPRGDARARVREKARLEREAEAAKLNGYVASEHAKRGEIQTGAASARQKRGPAAVAVAGARAVRGGCGGGPSASGAPNYEPSYGVAEGGSGDGWGGGGGGAVGGGGDALEQLQERLSFEQFLKEKRQAEHANAAVFERSLELAEAQMAAAGIWN